MSDPGAQTDWRLHGVRVVRGDALDPNTPQTPGMRRAAAISTARGGWAFPRDPYLLETSVPGIFACGDVRFGPVKRVAAAVGEGSMAIAFVHQYLREAAAAEDEAVLTQPA